MAFRLVNPVGLIPTSAFDVVAVYDSGFRQVFQGARITGVMVNPESKKMEHPREDGSKTTDFNIFNQIEIQMFVILPSYSYRNAYQQIKQFYLNQEFVSVQTRTDIFTNQVLQAMPQEENPEYYDTISMTLKFKQTQLSVTVTNTITPREAQDNTTVNRGTVQAAPVPEPQKASLVKRIFS